MDPILYNAILESDIGVIKQKTDQLGIQLTPNKNTVVHVTAQFHSSGKCVQEILKMQPSLLLRVNCKGETALHIAARNGHSNIVKELIACAKTQGEDVESRVRITKEMLWMTNEDGDTALHEAVRNNHLNVVNLLIEQDPEFSHAANSSGETPLYLAAERHRHDILHTILRVCTSPAHGGPNGRTALHAAVISGCLACTQDLLKRYPSLVKEADIDGWTSLHYAARCNRARHARELLIADRSTAYLADKENGNTALHLAAREGHVDIMKALLLQCPDCWEMENGRGQNVLHIAVEHEKENVIKFILEKLFFSNLVNQKDNDGNTPIHLLAAADCDIADLLRHPRADKGALNKKNLTPRDIAMSNDRYRIKEDIIKEELKKADAPFGWRNVVSRDTDYVTEWKKARAEYKKILTEQITKMSGTHLIVAALVATVTFAAGFTVPGGDDGNAGTNQGMAVLVKNGAFKAFVVTNTTAMITSSLAVFMYLILSVYKEQGELIKRYSVAFDLILVAMGAMLLAFITGSYAVLAKSVGLSVVVCIIGGSSYLVYYFVLRKLDRDYFSF